MTDEHLKKVEVAIALRTSPESIISAFTDAESLRGWWGVERMLVEKKTGGVYTLAWNVSEIGFGYVSTGVIKEYDPGGLLVVGNMVYMNPARPMLGPMTLSIRAAGKMELSELYLCQDGYGESPDWDWYYDAVKTAWPEVLNSLKQYLERKTGDTQA